LNVTLHGQHYKDFKYADSTGVCAQDREYLFLYLSRISILNYLNEVLFLLNLIFMKY